MPDSARIGTRGFRRRLVVERRSICDFGARVQVNGVDGGDNIARITAGETMQDHALVAVVDAERGPSIAALLSMSLHRTMAEIATSLASPAQELSDGMGAYQHRYRGRAPRAASMRIFDG